MYMSVIYCSIGTFLSKRTMLGCRNGELGRCLLSIKNRSVIYERKYHPILPERDDTIRGSMGMVHDYKQKS